MLYVLRYILFMQVTNPLVTAQMGPSNAIAALVANAPSAPDSNRYESSRPVTGSRQSERSRSDSGRPAGDSDGGSGRRGARVDISV
jgi:hypothetical protein